MPDATTLNATKLKRAGLGDFFRPTDLEAIGITEPTLRRLLREGTVEKVDRGLYHLAAAPPSQHFSVAAACARVPRAIVCLLTALQIHEIGTQVSPDVWLAIPHPARAPSMTAVRLRVVRFTGPLLTAGIESIRLDGVPTRITNPSRTVIDCFRLTRSIDRETVLEALREVLQSGKAAPAELLNTARDCNTERQVRTALEILG